MMHPTSKHAHFPPQLAARDTSDDLIRLVERALLPRSDRGSRRLAIHALGRLSGGEQIARSALLALAGDCDPTLAQAARRALD